MPTNRDRQEESEIPMFYKIIIGIILVLFCWVLLLNFSQTKQGVESIFTFWQARDYSDESQHLENVLKKSLRNVGVQSKSIINSFQKEITRGKVKWIYFSKEIRVPASRSLANYYMAISETVRKEGGRIFSCQLKGTPNHHLLIMKIGLKCFPTHSFSIRQSPQIAFIIDDFGYRMAKREKDFLKAGFPLTISVIPGLSYSQKTAQEAAKEGKEVILHLPMEPKRSFNNCYRWIILTLMKEKEIEKTVQESLRDVPFVVGVNNHMGSKATEDEKVMKIVLGAVKKKGLFFVDSKTSRNSVAFPLAQKLGVKAGKRQIFLDNRNDADYIKKQLYSLAEIALKEGQAIGIGHVTHSATLPAIKDFLPYLQRKEIELVYVSELVM